MKKFVAGNWKMNGSLANYSEIQKIAECHNNFKDNIDTVLFPPSVFIYSFAQDKSLPLGGQDCHVQHKGAFTGDISAEMLKNVGAEYVILGHSERRIGHHESNDTISLKVKTAHQADLKTVICIGETLEDYKAGRTKDVITKQLHESLPPCVTGTNSIIAYEPVWAIGTGLTPTPTEIGEVHAHIHYILTHLFEKNIADTTRLLYGGSVTSDNAKAIASIPYVHGALVGGASLTAEKFFPIMQAFAEKT